MYFPAKKKINKRSLSLFSLTGFKGGRERIKSRMMSCASLLDLAGASPHTITLFSLYLLRIPNFF